MRVYSYDFILFYLFITLPDLLLIYFAKFDCKLHVHSPPRLALLYAGCVFLQFVKFKH